MSVALRAPRYEGDMGTRTIVAGVGSRGVLLVSRWHYCCMAPSSSICTRMMSDLAWSDSIDEF